MLSFSDMRTKRYLASSVLLLLDIVTFIGIGFSMALTEPSLFFPVPPTVQLTFYACLAIIIMVLFHYDFYTCFHAQTRRYQNKVVAAISALVLFIIMCTLIILRQPIDTLPALVLLFGFVGYVVVSRMIATMVFAKREKVVYWGEHVEHALSHSRLRESYLVGQVLRELPTIFSFTIYKRSPHYSVFSHRYRFDCLVVDIDILQQLPLLTLQDLLISPFILKVYQPSTQSVRPLLAKELLQLAEPVATPLCLVNEKSNICLADRHPMPVALQDALAHRFNVTSVDCPQLHYLSIRLEKETPQVIQNIISVYLQNINNLAPSTMHVLIQQNTLRMTKTEQALNAWLAQAFRQKARLSGIKLCLIGIGDLDEDMECYLLQQRTKLATHEPITLNSPYDEFHLHGQLHIDGLCHFIQQVITQELTGEYQLASSPAMSTLMLIEHMILGEGLVPRTFSDRKLRNYEVPIGFSQQYLNPNANAEKVVTGSEYAHIHTVADNMLSYETFELITRWLLNASTPKNIDVMQEVLVTQVLPNGAHNQNTVLGTKQIFDR